MKRQSLSVADEQLLQPIGHADLARSVNQGAGSVNYIIEPLICPVF